MRIEATKGKKRIVTQVKDATYVEAVRRGGHRWWRYVLGLVIGQATEIAQAVVFLCSDAASYITGQPLAIDGGYTVS